MDIKINERSFFVFDLDDTLFFEIDFLRSAYRHIAKQIDKTSPEDLYNSMLNKYNSKENVFAWLLSNYSGTIPTLDQQWLLQNYREHLPDITLSKEATAFVEQLKRLKIPTGLITDGRSVTQRNKLKALGLDSFFTDIIISEEFGSEKPDPRNYLHFQNKYPNSEFFFFGDNLRKDFIVPNNLGWTTICILNAGENIHPQDWKDGMTTHAISSFSELNILAS